MEVVVPSLDTFDTVMPSGLFLNATTHPTLIRKGLGRLRDILEAPPASSFGATTPGFPLV
jgi:hypothetical protein